MNSFDNDQAAKLRNAIQSTTSALAVLTTSSSLQTVLQTHLAELLVRERALFGCDTEAKPVDKATPGYPDDNGKWVEVPPGARALPPGLDPNALIEVLTYGERQSATYAGLVRPAKGWLGLVEHIAAYRVVSTAAKDTPWYPDDSGKWVEVPPDVGNRPDGLHPATLVATLSSGERDERQHRWPAPLKARNWNWRDIVAYKVVEPAVEQNAETHPPQAPGVTAPQLLEKAASHMRDRAATYDRPEGERSMAKTVAAFNAITGRDLTETEGWLLLQVLKDVRLFQRPGYHADSAEDGIAYAALKAESKSKEV